MRNAQYIRWKHAGGLCVALLFCAPLRAQAPPAEQPPVRGGVTGVVLDSIVAVVNHDVVLESELKRHLRILHARRLRAGGGLPDPALLQRETLENLIFRKLQLQRAAQQKVTVETEILQRALQSVAAKNGLQVEEFREVLEEDGFDFTQFLREMNDELTINKLRARQVESRISISEQEVDRYLKSRRVQADMVEYRIGHILLTLDQEADEQQRAERERFAVELSEQLRAGDDFRQAAREYSAARGAAEGGDLDWRPAKDLPSLFAPLVMAMQPGESSAPVPGSGGYHIIKLYEVRNAGGPLMVNQTRARQILILPEDQEEGEKTARRHLEKLKARIEKGQDFAELARVHSQDPKSAPRGGDLGWVSEGALAPEMEKLLGDLEPGTLSEPLRSSVGWHLIEVLERQVVDNLEEAQRAQARNSIRQRKTKEALEEWLNLLKNESYIEYRLPAAHPESASTG